jgi:hypothetical protein
LSGTIRLFTQNAQGEYHYRKDIYSFNPHIDLLLKKDQDSIWSLDTKIKMQPSNHSSKDEICLSVHINGTGYIEKVQLEEIELSLNQKEIIHVEGTFSRLKENFEAHANINGDALNLHDLRKSFQNLLPAFIWHQIPFAELNGNLRLLTGTIQGNPEQLHFQVQSKLNELYIRMPSQNIDMEGCNTHIALSGTADQNGFKNGEISTNIQIGKLKYGINDTTAIELGASNILLRSSLGNDLIPLQGQLKGEFTELCQGRLAALIDWDNKNHSPVDFSQLNIKGTLQCDSLSLSELPIGDLDIQGMLNLDFNLNTNQMQQFTVNLNCETPGLQYVFNESSESTPPIRLHANLNGNTDSEFHRVSLDSALIVCDGLLRAVFSGKYNQSSNNISIQLASMQLYNQYIPDFIPGSLKAQMDSLSLSGNENLTIDIQGILSEDTTSAHVNGCLSLNSLGMTSPDQGIEIDQLDGKLIFQGNLNALHGNTSINMGEFRFREMHREPYRDADLQFGWYWIPGDSFSVSNGRLDAHILGLSSSFLLDIGNMYHNPNLRTEMNFLFHSQDSIFLFQDLQLLGKLGFHLSGATTDYNQPWVLLNGLLEVDHFMMAKGKDLVIQNACGSIPVELKVDLKNQTIISDTLFRPLTWIEYENQQQLYKTYSEFVKQLEIDTIRLDEYQMENVVFDLGVTEGYIQVPSFHINLFDGNLGGSILLDLGSLEKERVEYAIQAQASRINSAVLADIQTAKEEETELNMTMSFKGKGVDLDQGIELEGFFYITKMGPKFASTLLEGMDPSGSDRSIRMTRRLLNTGWKPKLFSFDLRHGYVYPSLMLNQPWFSPIRIPGKLEYSRLPLAFFLKNLQSSRE